MRHRAKQLAAMVAALVLLQGLDIYTILALGGLAVEANPMLAYLWQAGGIGAVIAVKVAAIGMVCIAWGIFDSMPELERFRQLLGILAVMGSALPVGWNISIMLLFSNLVSS